MVFKRKKLLNRLLFTTLLTTFIPLLVAGLYLIPKIGWEIQQQAEDRLLSHTMILSNYIQGHFIIPIRYLLQNLGTNAELLNQEQVRAVLDQHQEIAPFVHSIFELFPDRKAKIWYSRNQDELQGLFHLFSGSDSLFSDSLFVLRSRLLSQDEKYYRLAIGLKTRSHSLFFALVDLPQFYSRLVGLARGQRYSSNFGIYDREQGRVLFARSNTALPSFRQMRGENVYSSGKNNEYVGAYVDIDSFVRWRVFSQLPRSRFAGPVKNLWLHFGLILLLGFLLSFLGTIYYWRRITRPLERFARGATEIARGNFDQKIHLESDDEIGRLARLFNYMTIELRRLNNMNLNRIITERTKTKTIIKNIGDGIIVIDENDHIVTINMAVEKWFGIHEQEVVEKPIRNVIEDAGLLRLIEEIKETDLQGTFTRELPILLAGQSHEKIFQARATRILSQEKKFMGIVAILRDITQEKEIDRMKTELVSMVAHELRSPLTSISGFAELLLSPTEPPESIREYAHIIRQEAVRLADLVNKFLDITKIEAGRMDFKLARIRIKDILDNILHIAATQAQKKEIQLFVDLSDENLELYADEKMIAEVILNLLSNAIKYSPERTKVKLQVAADTTMTNITVVDQGFGISKEHLPNIFKKFYRIKDDPRIQEERGTGLGLALVKEIVELHNGQISVESQVGKGTTFKVRLPKQKKTTGWEP